MFYRGSLCPVNVLFYGCVCLKHRWSGDTVFCNSKTMCWLSESPYCSKPRKVASWRSLRTAASMPLGHRMSLTPQKLWLGSSKQGVWWLRSRPYSAERGFRNCGRWFEMWLVWVTVVFIEDVEPPGFGVTDECGFWWFGLHMWPLIFLGLALTSHWPGCVGASSQWLARASCWTRRNFVAAGTGRVLFAFTMEMGDATIRALPIFENRLNVCRRSAECRLLLADLASSR